MTQESILAQEFLDELDERAEKHFKGLAHEAFVDWFVEAEFGPLDWHFTDHSKDGGIDAVIWRPNDDPAVILVQSKFHGKVGRGAVSDKNYKEFNNAVRAFRYGGETFDEWLDTVRTDLKPIYRRALETLEKSRSWFQQKKAFRLITTSTRGNRRLEARELPVDSYFYAPQVMQLYRQFRQGETPKARDLHLQIDNKLPYKDSNRATSYLVNAKVADFRRYLDDNDVARLVARNIRFNLGSKIADKVKKTYERFPGDFWYFHNGLTIICEDFIETKDNAILVGPSVINGAQTLYAISSSGNRNSDALVTARIIVKPESRTTEDSRWLLQLIRSVNSQNPVQEADLRSNEPEQLFLQSKFREFGVYYERKRGEWKTVRNDKRYRKLPRLSMRRLGQALTVCSQKGGQGIRLVKAGSDSVFVETNYKLIFPSRKRIASRFDRLYFVYRLMNLLEQKGYGSSDEGRKQQHAFWNCLWLADRGLASRLDFSELTASSLSRAFDEYERGSSQSARRARRVLRTLTKEVWQAFKRYSRRDPDKWTPNNFFKQTPGIEGLASSAYPKVRASLQKLGAEIQKRAST